MAVRIKRVYEDATDADGYRVLVDRVWPRGVSKERAAVDEWLKEAGPSTELRTWFGHVPERFEQFSQRYRQELDGNEATKQLREIVAAHEVVTLVYSAKDEQHNQAAVLRELLTS
jgi:DNA-3-methyladenine glycosylase